MSKLKSNILSDDNQTDIAKVNTRIVDLQPTDNLKIDYATPFDSLQDGTGMYSLKQLIDFFKEQGFITKNEYIKDLELGIGVDLWFNVDEKFRDQLSVKIGKFEYLRANQIVKAVDYPLLADKRTVINGSFQVLNIQDGFLRNVTSKDKYNNLGSFQGDAMQRIRGEWKQDRGVGVSAGGAFFMEKVNATGIWSGLDNTYIWSNILKFDSSLVVRTDLTNDETRPKNVWGQFYVKAKIIDAI